MFEIFFGIIWTGITAMVTYGFYGNIGGTITVNGEVVSQAEFSAMLGPKLFLGLFWAIGIFFIVRGFLKVKRNKDTDIKGEICYGRITNVYNSGTYVNGRPLFKADIKIYIPSINETKILSEEVGFDRYVYAENSYIEVKYYNNDINIERFIEVEDIPSIAAEHIVRNDFKENDNDTIIIDGVEYVKRDSIDDGYRY